MTTKTTLSPATAPTDFPTEDLIEGLIRRVFPLVRKGARATGKLYCKEDLQQTARSALWIAQTTNPSELMKTALRVFFQISDLLQDYQNLLRLSEAGPAAYREVASILDRVGAKTTADTLAYTVAAPNTDPLEYWEEREYHDKVKLKLLLAALIEEWQSPDLALAFVLNTAYGYSVPTILDFYQPREKVTDAALRKRAWAILSECKIHAVNALQENAHSAPAVEAFRQT